MLAPATLRILVLDDEEYDFKILARHLQSVSTQNYEVVYASSTHAARHAIAEKQFDAAFIDYKLAETLTGLDFVWELGGREAPFPIIMLTAFGDGEIDRRALFSGAFDYIDKSSMTRELLDRSIRYAIKSSQYEQRLRASYKEAAGHAAISQQILSVVSYQMKSPIETIGRYCGVLTDARRVDGTDNAVLKINAAAQRLKDCLKYVTEFIQLGVGSMELNRQQFHLKTMLDEAVEHFQANADRKRISLISEIDHSANIHVMGDRLRIRQILINLIDNAVRYSNHGTIIVNARWEEDQLMARVRDQGRGIPHESVAKILAEEIAPQEPDGKFTGGLGLGLWTCRRLLQMMQGSLVLESTLGAGTTAGFDLPICAAQDADVA